MAFATVAPRALAGSIHSDVALTPREGGHILRLQYTYSEADAHADIQQINRSTVRATYIYGLRANLALLISAPYVNQQVDRIAGRSGRVEEAHDGVGDVTLLAKYRFWQHDAGPQQTQRWAVLGGMRLRSGDANFSSDSYDPIVGTVFTWRSGRKFFDADLVYRFGTGSGKSRLDTLRYDLAYSYRLAPAEFQPGRNTEWNLVAELNGRYRSDGAHELLLSPGLQFVMERCTLEASIQWPVVQNLARDEAEIDFRLVMGVRFHW